MSGEADPCLHAFVCYTCIMHGKSFTGDSSFTFSLRLNSSVQNRLPRVVS